MDSDKAQIVSETSDVETVEEEEMDTSDKAKMQEAVLRNPQLMAALQARLDSMVGDPSGYIKVSDITDLMEPYSDIVSFSPCLQVSKGDSKP